MTALPGWHTTSDPTGRTWGDRVRIRFVPSDPLDSDIYNRLYTTIRDRIFARSWPRASVLADEAETVLPANGAAKAAVSLVFSGRKWPTAHAACSTRPKKISLALRANLTHAAIWPLPSAEDRKTMAGDLSIPLADLEQLMRRTPQGGYLWWETATRTIRPVELVLPWRKK